MLIIPNLIDIGAPVVFTSRTGLGGIVSWSTAANVWHSTVLLGQSILHIAQCVRRGVTRADASLCEPVICRIALIVHDGCFVELDNFLVIDVFGAIAGHVKG